MMNKFKRFYSLFLVLVLIITLVPINVQAATKIKLNKTKVSLYVGQTINLKVTGTKNKVKWSSTKKSIATISQKGKVIAKKKGSTIIKAKVNNKTLKCQITVKNPYLNKKTVSLKIGDSVTLKLIGSKTTSWNSSNKKVATVNKKGKVIAISKGTTTIKVKASNKKTYSCKIIVTEQNKVTITSTIIPTKVPKITKAPNITKIPTSTIVPTITVFPSVTITTEPEIPTITNTPEVTKEPIVTKKPTITSVPIISYVPTITEVLKISGIPTITKMPTITNTPEITKIPTVTKEPTITSIPTIIEAPSITESPNITNIPSETNTPIPTEHIHNYIQIEFQNSTCIETGRKTYICECGNSYTEEISLKEHIYEISNVEPTCEEKGYTLHTCSYCGKSYKTNYINENGHNWDDGTTILVAKCSEYGLVQYHCNNCSKFKSITIPELGHKTSEEWIIEEFCSEIGCKYQMCLICGSRINEQKLPPTGKHKYLSDGYCKECDYYSEENHQHNYNETILKESSCLEIGKKLYTCACGDSYTEEIVKLNHTKTDWIIDKNATCEESGSKHIECSVCKEVIETKEIEGLGHKYELVNTTLSTCTTKGYNEYVCNKCGNSYKEELPLKEHTYGHFVEKVKPLDFETFGTANMVCPECNETLFEDLTAVLIDLGNGESTTIYGYYNYEEAYKNFELTYQYKLDKGILETTDKFEWDEEMYHLSCIRVAEMAYMDNLYDLAKNSEELGIDLHTRPNNQEIMSHAENALGCPIIKNESAQYAIDSWLGSIGHKLTIELSYPNKMSTAMFNAWMSNKSGMYWRTFWVQNYMKK